MSQVRGASSRRTTRGWSRTGPTTTALRCFRCRTMEWAGTSRAAPRVTWNGARWSPVVALRKLHARPGSAEALDELTWCTLTRGLDSYPHPAEQEGLQW